MSTLTATQKIKSPMWFPGRNSHERWRGCIGYWPMWAGAGLYAADLSRMGRRGTIDGATWNTSPGAYGKEIVFDGTDDLIGPFANDAGLNNNDPNAIRTIAALMHVTDYSSASRVVVGKSNNTYYGTYGQSIDYSNGTIYARGNDAAADTRISGSYPDDDAYHFVVATYAVAGSLWLDGVQLASGDISKTYAYHFGIGCSRRHGARKANEFVGRMAMVAIWDRVFTDGEIVDLSLDPFCMIRQPAFDWGYAGAIMGAAAAVEDDALFFGANF